MKQQLRRARFIIGGYVKCTPKGILCRHCVFDSVCVDYIKVCIKQFEVGISHNLVGEDLSFYLMCATCHPLIHCCWYFSAISYYPKLKSSASNNLLILLPSHILVETMNKAQVRINHRHQRRKDIGRWISALKGRYEPEDDGGTSQSIVSLDSFWT